MANKRKIFFLHIPKAAGSSVNKMLSKGFDESRVAFHVEKERSTKYTNLKISELDMFSGHVMLSEVKRLFPIDDFLRVTVVRDPFLQLISHINWIKHISEDQESAFFYNHPELVREFSLKLRALNFDNLSEVESFFHNLPDIGKNSFNNCQTRYLYDGKVPRIILESDAQIAIKGLAFFDVVGTVEKIDEFVKQVYTRMNWDFPVNIVNANALNNRYNLDVNSPQLKEILLPLYSADKIVYDHVVQKEQEGAWKKKGSLFSDIIKYFRIRG